MINMEGILKQLKKQRAKLVATAEHRDEYFTNRTEKWQESPAAALYETKTQGIAEVIDKLDSTITELNNLLNAC